MIVPDTLYKYTTSETASIVLETGKLRWQSPCQFNDVHELQRMPVLSPSFEEGRSIYAQSLVDIIYISKVNDFLKYSQWSQDLLSQIAKLKNNNVSAQEALEKIQPSIPKSEKALGEILRISTENNNDGSLRCFCLTESKNNGLMWGHYGESYAGCVFGFRHIEKLSTPFHAAEKVEYYPEAPVIGSALDFLLYGPTKELNKATRLSIYYSKSLDWSYEKEWRVIVKRPHDQKKYSDFKFYPEELESITIGPRMDASRKANILNLINSRYSNCEIYQIVNNDGVSHRVLMNR